MTEAAAITAIASRVPVDGYPSLTAAELSTIASEHLLYTTRANSTAYAVGAAVSLATTNGRWYRCIEAGTSETTEALAGFPLYTQSGSGMVIQDGTVLWQDQGPIPPDSYDISGAVKAAWLLKASKAAQDIDTSDQDQSTKASQVQAQCLAMAARNEGAWVV